ncbi:hypothetical protein [Methanobacterium sp. BAmetb5]|uniref:hypothetical protein n=1 Tax=Methanobacterium sp. BAmetb5 TaxID=2025351 RepID=UPI0025CED83D|nr:hypothetical protein [Methanobacterium sp. BAmetb5]
MIEFEGKSAIMVLRENWITSGRDKVKDTELIPGRVDEGELVTGNVGEKWY